MEESQCQKGLEMGILEGQGRSEFKGLSSVRNPDPIPTVPAWVMGGTTPESLQGMDMAHQSGQWCEQLGQSLDLASMMFWSSAAASQTVGTS